MTSDILLRLEVLKKFMAPAENTTIGDEIELWREAVEIFDAALMKHTVGAPLSETFAHEAVISATCSLADAAETFLRFIECECRRCVANKGF